MLVFYVMFSGNDQIMTKAIENGGKTVKTMRNSTKKTVMMGATQS